MSDGMTFFLIVIALAIAGLAAAGIFFLIIAGIGQGCEAGFSWEVCNELMATPSP